MQRKELDITCSPIDINDCQPDPCGENGTCIDLTNSFICICDPGYTGPDCHTLCDDGPCNNNSSCSLCEEGSCGKTRLPYTCSCASDTYGVLCTDST